MIKDRFVLPTLIPDDEELDAGKMLAQLRKRSSSTSNIDGKNIVNLATIQQHSKNNIITPSMRVSSRSSRSGSYSSRPPSSFRAFKADSDSASTTSSHPINLPAIRKRTSSLTLEAKTRANAISHKALPSTPISATPSLTFSHSRTESRSDEEAFASSSSSATRYSPEYRRHALLDYTHNLDALDQFEEHYLLSEEGNDALDNVRNQKMMIPLPLFEKDGKDDLVIIDAVPTKAKKKKQVAFKSKNQRYPDKDNQIAEEEYREGNRKAVQGQLRSQSTVSLISSSKGGFKSLFSTMRGKMKREDGDVASVDEGHWRGEKRKVEKRERQEMNRQDEQSGAPSQNTPDKGKSRERTSSELQRPQGQPSVFYDQRKESSMPSNHNVEPPRMAKRSQSIDALYEMLQPCVLEQQERERRELIERASSPVSKQDNTKKRSENSSHKALVEASIKKEISAVIEKQPLHLERVNTFTRHRILSDAKPVIISAPIPQVTPSMDQLPPLTSQLSQCLALDRKEEMHPWKHDKERIRLLTASCPLNAIPKSWSAYIRGYAKGDFDLSNPPLPRSSPLVKKAVPRSSPRVDVPSPTTPSSMLGSNWSTPSSGPRTRMTSKDSAQSFNIFYDSNNYPLPVSPIHQQQSLRDRLPSPRFVAAAASIGKNRSREASYENMRLLPREDKEETRMQAEELAAVGGMGDIKGPRPTWEAERSASARIYLHDHYHQPSVQLQVIVERLANLLKVSHASVQILVAEESVVLASTGLEEEDYANVYSSPQMEDIIEGEVKILMRDETLDAHTILQRDGAPVVIADMTKDWRFETRLGATLPFYAGASILASDTGLPIGTVSVRHHQSKEMTLEEKAILVKTAKEVEGELLKMQSKALEMKLEQLDRGILGWVANVQTNATQTKVNNTISKGEASSSISPSPATLLHFRLSSALQTMLSALQVDFAYIARIGSDPLQCELQFQQELGVYRTGSIKLDAALHLCALAANKHGLCFETDSIKVGQLIEEQSTGNPHFISARVVACGLKEGGKAHRGTEGWVLGVASRNNGRIDAASGVYMMKFATLIAPLLLQGREPSSSQWLERREDSLSLPLLNGTSTTRDSPIPTNRLPIGPRRSRRKIPLASPPPGTPLPLPPVMATMTTLARKASTRKTILASTSSTMNKSAVGENEPSLDAKALSDDSSIKPKIRTRPSRGQLSQSLEIFKGEDFKPPRSSIRTRTSHSKLNQHLDSFDNDENEALLHSVGRSSLGRLNSGNLFAHDKSIHTSTSRGQLRRDNDNIDYGDSFRYNHTDYHEGFGSMNGKASSKQDPSGHYQSIDNNQAYNALPSVPPRKPRMRGGLRSDAS